MGSVKDLTVIRPPEESSPGEGVFRFSDRYSVFDWGEMPDLIPRKGEAINMLAAYFFEKLQGEGIKTHYAGVVEDGEAKKLDDVKKPSSEMRVSLLNVIKPAVSGGVYDYSPYKSAKGCFLIPLEVIYRNSLPEGSSVFKRLKEGSINPSDLGLGREPSPGEKLVPPILDVSTKLEITDRYITWEEAAEISGLAPAEAGALKETALGLDRVITGEFSRIGLVNEDGKFEFGFGPSRELMVVDVMGTLDECRFTWNGLPVSKEIARLHYRNTPWHRAVEEAKKSDRENWKEICELSPEPLPAELKKAVSDVYCACTNEVSGRKWFDVPEFTEVMDGLRRILG